MQLSAGAPVVIRPGGVGEVLDVGIRLARRNYWPLVLVGAWALVPWYVLEAIVSLLGGTRQRLIAATLSQDPSLLLWYVLFIVASVVVLGLESLALFFACGRLISGENAPGEMNVAPLYRLALGRLGAYVLLIIIFIVIAIPLTILFPLGIFLVVRWSVSLDALVLEGKGPFAALGRSWQLTRGASSSGRAEVWNCAKPGGSSSPQPTRRWWASTSSSSRW